MQRIIAVLLMLLLSNMAASDQHIDSEDETTDPSAHAVAPDLREDELKLKLQKGDFVIVPVPISNPTLDTGLVVGGAYFYPQSEQQKKVQPASMTAAAAMYTSNDSAMFGLGHQSYWDQDTWRLGGAIGYANLKLSLLTPVDPGTGPSVNWNIRGNLAFARLSRKILGDWYVGVSGRFVNFEQSIGSSDDTNPFDQAEETKTAGFGLIAEYDSRDMPMNSYSGRLFQFGALFNDEAFGSDVSYQSYKIAYRSYYELSVPVVLAWEVQACHKSGAAPLWDLCTVKLRGFAATDYLSVSSASGQFEARWRMTGRWGLVGFAGVGYSRDNFSQTNDREPIPSYGIGVRFMVLKAKRINLRLDFARSTDSEAIYLSVGEAF